MTIIAPNASNPSDNVRSMRQKPYLGFYAGPEAPMSGDLIDLRYPQNKHILTFGPPGTNKSTGLVIPNLAMLRRSMIVIDPKGQICAVTKRIREKMGRVIIVNPFNELADIRPDMRSHGFNPMAQLNSAADLGTDARLIAQSMVEKVSEGKGEFFENSMENSWTAFTIYERMKSGKNASLRNVLAYFARPVEELMAALKEMSESDNFALRISGGAAYSRLTDKNSLNTSLQDVFATIIKNAAFLTDDRIGFDMRFGADMRPAEAIPFEKMHEETITVYLIIPAGQLINQSKYMRIFINLALGSLFRSCPRKEPVLPPVLFMLDEFGNLGRLPEIVNALSISRDYRVQMWMFLQYLQQLKNSYPNEWTGFFADSGAITTFSTGDWETADHLSKLFGKMEVEMTSRNNQGGVLTGLKNMHFGQSTATQVFPLIEPEDLRRLGKGGTMNLIDPCTMPIRGVAPGYWEIFPKGMLDPNPYYHG